MLKRILALIICLCLLCVTSACGPNSDTPADNSSSVVSSEVGSGTATTVDGVHKVTDTDNVTNFLIFTDTHIGGKQKGIQGRVEKCLEWANNDSGIDYVFFTGDNLDKGYVSTPKEMKEQLGIFNEMVKASNKPYYVMKGNHDPDVADPTFEKNLIIECGNVNVIGFFADYYEFNDEDYGFNYSTGKVSQKTIEWLDEAFSKSAGKRVILACHYSIVKDNENFSCPIEDVKNDIDFGRGKILELAEKYNCEVYFSGHEHNSSCPTGIAGTLTNYSIGSVTVPDDGGNQLFAEVTVTDSSMTVEIRTLKNPDEILKTMNYDFKLAIK